jgi:hypothetical protein
VQLAGVFALGDLLRLPLLLPLGQDAPEEGGGRFVGRVLGNQAALAGSFEDGGFVASQLGPGTPQGSHAGIQAGELLFDLGDDALLLGEGREGKCLRIQIVPI